MKLFHSATSPFVRKVMACAIARGIDGRLELVTTNAQASPAELLGANPLSKVPALLTDDGEGLFDSPVICEYLDSIGDAPPLFPPMGDARWAALKQQALGDGMMDAGVARRGESTRPVEAARSAFMDRQKAAVDRAVMLLEAAVPGPGLDIGTIAIGCALGYLDFRYAHEAWRERAPKLAVWFAAFAAHPCMARTAPPDA